jgi:glycine/D-amino acid oxidase-like deaminating enzyme
VLGARTLRLFEQEYETQHDDRALELLAGCEPHLYEHSLKRWETLSVELNFNVMFSARGVLNLAHCPGANGPERPLR